MANDLRLPIGEDSPDATHPLPDSGYGGALDYVSQETGAIEFRRQPLPYLIRESVDHHNGNTVIIPTRIRSTDYHKARVNILGFHLSGGPNGSFKRRLPIGDEQGLGMVAVKIAGVKFHGQSKIKAGKETLFWRDGVSVQTDPTRKLQFFNDDCYNTTDPGSNGNYPGSFQNASTRFITAIRQTRYCILDIVFAHVPFNVASDTTIASGANEFGVNDERARYIWSQFDLGVEYTTSKAIVLRFTNDAEVPAALRLQPVGTDGGYLRPTGELTVHWEYIPRDSAAILSQKFEARIGKVNQASFNIGLFGEVRTYDPKAMIFMGYKSRDLMQTHGIPFYSFDMKFSYRRDGWNKFITGRSAPPYPVERMNGDPVYELTDFDELFRAS